MNYYKQLRKNRKKDELPSFLVGLTDAPEDITLAPKPHPSTHYLGPIFVGLCTNYQHHAPPHSLKLGSFHQPQFIMLPGADDISKLLYTQTKVDKITQTVNIKKREIKRPKIYHDIYPHKCVGSKRMFIPDITPHIIDLGKTRSIIEGEASIEIPLSRSHVPLRYRRKSTARRENDFITLSDLREEKRMFMSYKERIAHAHFPKEFTTVRVIGPPIPASITITKLPSKRRTESQFNLEIKSEAPKESITGETERTARRSIKSKPRKTSKRFSTKSTDQNIEDQEKAEEETEIRGEVYEEYSVGEEEEEFYGEGFEETEWEKRESEEVEKEEEEDAGAEEREERTTLVQEEPKAEEREGRTTLVKQESKAEEREGRTTLVKQESKAEEREGRSTLVKEEPKAEEREGRTTLVNEAPKVDAKEEAKTEVKEESKAVVNKESKIEAEGSKTLAKGEPKTEAAGDSKAQIKEEQKAEVKASNTKQEEAVSEQKAKGSSISSATSRKDTDTTQQDAGRGPAVRADKNPPNDHHH